MRRTSSRSSDGGRKKRAGVKQLHESLTKDELIKRLKALAVELQVAAQEDGPEQYKAVAESLGSPFILKHKDKEVCAYAACCLADILRIFAPDAPYDVNQLRGIFLLITNQLRGLEIPEKEKGNKDKPSHYIKKQCFYLLETLSMVKSFNICLEMDFSELIFVKLFKVLFSVVSEHHSAKEKNFMLDIMCPLVQESEAVSQQLLDTILVNLIEPNKTQNPSAYKLAGDLIQRTAIAIEPCIQMFLNSVLAGADSRSELNDQVYKLIQELNRVASPVLLSVIPQVELKTKSTDVEERLSVIKMLSELFSDEESNIATENRSLWNSYLGRFVDVNVDVRLECVRQAKQLLVGQPALVPDVSAKLDERNRDPEDRVRQELVITICEAAAENIACVSDKLFEDVCERLWDKKVSVRIEALKSLGKLYKKVTTGATLNVKTAKKLCWIPNKLIRCYYRSDFEDRISVERILLSCLVPVTLEAKLKMRRLLSMFSSLEEKTAEAVHYILKRQLSVRTDLAKLVELTDKETSEANEKEIFSTIVKLARTVPDHYRAQEHLKKLRQLLKEPRMKEAVKTSLNPNVGCAAVCKAQNEVLTKLGSKNPICETVSLFLDRASPSLVDEACAKILTQLVQKDLEGIEDGDEDDLFEKPEESDNNTDGARGMFLLVGLASVFPSQFQNNECFEQILVFLRNTDAKIVEYALQILAHVGGGLEKCSSSLLPCYQPVVSKLATRGNPRQAKHAIRSIAKIFNTTAVLERVISNLVTTLSFDSPLLLTELTSLGEIAVLAPSLFNDKAGDTVCTFVKEELLLKDRNSDERIGKGNSGKNEWCDDCDVSREAQAKVKGIKLLVKWLKGLEKSRKSAAEAVVRLLQKLLEHGGDKSLPVTDRSRLRLAAACGVLKIAEESRYRDAISLRAFQEVALIMQDSCYEVRDKFTKKLHRALDQSTLPLNYFGIFALASTDPSKERKTQVKQMIAKNVANKREYIKQHSFAQVHAHQILPEYALPCVIHLLAHHPDFNRQDADTLNVFKDCLWFFMEPIMVKADNYSFMKKLVETIKQAKDAQDPDNEEANHAVYSVCDLALGLLSNKVQTFVLKDFPGNPVLPKMFLPAKLESPNTKSYLPKGFLFTKKKATFTEGRSTPSKVSKSSSTKPSESASKTKTSADKKEKRRTTRTNRAKKSFKEMANELDSPSDDSSEGEDSHQDSPRNRKRGSSEKGESSRNLEVIDDRSSRNKSKPGKAKAESKGKKTPTKTAKSPLRSPPKRSPFASPEELITKKPKPSPKRGRAARRLASELDSMPEDIPDDMSDASGPVGHDVSKKPVSSKRKMNMNGVSQSSDEGSNRKNANAKRKNNGSSSAGSPTKKKRATEVEPKQPVLNVKRRDKRRR